MSVSLVAVCAARGSSRPSSANELARKVINNEYQVEARDHSHWIFRLEEKKPGADELKGVVEAKSGDLERAISMNGKPLSSQDEEEWERRLQQETRTPAELNGCGKTKWKM
jgi:hypothetical protein